ncbi:hypothetical protein ACFQ7B_41395, partial [Streptomyces erythrochromogenes]|uniref:hypothetical protein n=1 Tax=Streptomyces erythrochromogenes TaxID=285574 RepID=UPI00367CD4F6
MTLTGPAHLTTRGTICLNTAWPPPARNGERGLQQPHGVPTLALLARAERGLGHLADLHAGFTPEKPPEPRTCGGASYAEALA